MSVTDVRRRTEASERADAVGTARPEGAAPRRSDLSRGRLLATPLLVGATGLLTYLWVSRQELGAPERALLNAEQLLRLTREHLDVSLTSTGIVLITAIPLGILLTRPGTGAAMPAATLLANIGQAMTAFGLMVLIFLQIFDGRLAAISAMAVYSFLPVLRGTLVGLGQIDPDIIKAARGMGMSRFQVLRRVELPLSVPVILAGIRTALVLNVATTTVAALIGAGGLGRLIVGGFETARDTLIVAGFVATAGIAILADWVGALAEDLLRPKGL